MLGEGYPEYWRLGSVSVVILHCWHQVASDRLVISSMLAVLVDDEAREEGHEDGNEGRRDEHLSQILVDAPKHLSPRHPRVCHFNLRFKINHHPERGGYLLSSLLRNFNFLIYLIF